MSKFSTLAASAVISLALAGCGGVQAASTEDVGAGSNQGSTVSTPWDEVPSSYSESTLDESQAPEDLVAAFGEAFAWEDGLAVTVGKPKKYVPSEYAAGTDGFDTYVAFEVRIVNKTGSAWDPTLFTASVQSNNEEASQVYDSEKLRESPRTKVLNGREAKFTVAFGVANPSDLVMEVAPDFEHESVLFQK